MPFHHVLRPQIAVYALLPITLAAGQCFSTVGTCSELEVECRRQGSWSVATSRNFHVCSLRGMDDAACAARRCEELRALLNRAWQFPTDHAPWLPKCHVVLHADARSYVATVGRGSEGTNGSSLVKPSTGTITKRRIDLCTAVPGYLDEVLPHEMCHMLLADHFRERPAPLWYDEGMAILVDRPGKLKLHERDLRDGMNRGSAFRLSELMATETYPASNRMGVFYGQCAALTQHMLRLGTPAQLHEFVSIIPSVGVNDALRSTYGIAGVTELERRWADSDRPVSLRSVASLLPTQSLGKHFGVASVVK